MSIHGHTQSVGIEAQGLDLVWQQSGLAAKRACAVSSRLVVAIPKQGRPWDSGNGSSSERTTLGEPRYLRQARPGGVALIDFRGTA